MVEAFVLKRAQSFEISFDEHFEAMYTLVFPEDCFPKLPQFAVH